MKGLRHCRLRCGAALQRVMFALCLVVVCAVQSAGLPAAAQDTGNTSSVIEAIKPALEQAARDGATVIVVGNPSDQAKSAGAANEPGLAVTLNRAMFRLRVTVANAGEALGNMSTTLSNASPDGKINWLFYSLLAGIVSIVLGRVMVRPVTNWIRDLFAPRIPDMPTSRQQKIGYVLFRGGIFIVTALMTASIASLIVIAYAGEHEPSMATGLAVVWTYTSYRLMRAIYINFLVPNVPNYRMINMDDGAAQSLYQSLLAVTAIIMTILGVCVWMDHLGLDRNTHKLILVFGSLLGAMLICLIAVIHRRSVAQAIAGFGDLEDKPFWQKTLSRSWHVVLIVYMMGAWAVSALRLLLDQPQSGGLVAAPMLALIGALILYGIALVIVDKVFAGEADASEADSEPVDAEPVTIEAEATELGSEVVASDDAEPDTPVPAAPQPSVFKGLFEHAAGLGVTFLALASIARVWGIRITDPSSWVARSLEVIVILFIAYIAYRAAELWIDSKVEQEEPQSDGEVEIGGDPGGAGASRLATLLPIFRNFLLITIVTIAGMIALAEMGVNIAPLFAGAGVVGLAIGFGAQTLIRDIFSGAFFLIDDAFRKGEYIDIGTAKGTVEKISIRSMQLRHHNGPLNTIPFGEIKQLTNFSRDWVMMKLPLRLTYDTDIERVRKLVKRLGIELMDHPEIGDKFLQPLKSQGVKQMDDSAMIVRVKFMTKPGDQFDVRKVVYQRIREIFEENNIQFAHREVTVRIAGEDNKPPDEAKKKAVVGAVQTVIENPQP